jgi:peroxiredoxin Q/BCP
LEVGRRDIWPIDLLRVKRATFVIGTDQVIIEVVTSELNMNTHADKALAALGG